MELYENLVIKQDGKYLLLNLYNFKKEYLAEKEFFQLKDFILEGDISGKQIFFDLLEKEQFLNEKKIAAIDLFARVQSKRLSKKVLCEMQISLSFECNLSCYYCYQSGRNSSNKRMEISDIDKIYKFCQKYERETNTTNDIQLITISGGEPLLENNIVLINYIAEKFKESRLKILTNGINLKKYWSSLPLHKIDEIQISLDGDDEIIAKVSGRSKVYYFEDIIQAIRIVACSGKKVKVASILTEVSSERVKQIFFLLEKADLLKYQNLSVYFSLITDYKNQLGISNQYNLVDLANEARKIREVIKLYRNVEVNFFSDLIRLKSILKDYYDINRLYVGRSCGRLHGIGITFIPTGEVYWCNERIGELGQIGNYQNEKFFKENYEEICKRSIYTISECHDCKFRFICGAGCPIKIGENMNEWKKKWCGVFQNNDIMDNVHDFIL